MKNYKVILTGSDRVRDKNYDMLFTKLDAADLFGRASSEDEYRDEDDDGNDFYTVEIKHIPDTVEEWAERQKKVEIIYP
ncbi:MAG: hypothetical protein GY710_02110 [Desulfobacteraceae bacterium]|nr:hypothetical protein [Desulfobacteraceae bacterium]